MISLINPPSIFWKNLNHKSIERMCSSILLCSMLRFQFQFHAQEGFHVYVFYSIDGTGDDVRSFVTAVVLGQSNRVLYPDAVGTTAHATVRGWIQRR